ncbi:hypothetical protein FNH22_18965 [Fulvivirga sp. M361]|uniref:hypothetical protein n=1 Tax=Fulvivirga sp. M361 TaxID=2594266 RepID=UPI001179F703|nr:hypothetical protein [Fulvivirga sp. M361]TRX54837.1 hypothetical protein FNH22_18965 [Fulvivirga sp. M361]
MLRKILLLVTLLFRLFNLNAQEQGNIKLKIEAGFDLEKPGLFLNVEPKVRATKNSVIGLRVGVVGYSGTKSVSTIDTQTTGNNADFEYIINEKSGNGIISFVPTFDHYLNENIFLNKHFFRPYLGLGVGYYLLGTYIEVTQLDKANASEDEIKGSVSNQVGLLVRGGIEFDKLIIGLEYNFTPKADIELPDGQTIGTIDLSFFGLSFGFTIGLGKSAK